MRHELACVVRACECGLAAESVPLNSAWVAGLSEDHPCQGVGPCPADDHQAVLNPRQNPAGSPSAAAGILADPLAEAPPPRKELRREG